MTAIKNRLKKLERVTDNSTVCACYPQYIETYIQYLGEDAETNEPVLTSEPMPNVCPNCCKPTVKQQITVQLCDQTTKDRFPNEWQAVRNKQKSREF